MDITEFYQAFFEEAEELLTEMEKLLLGLDVDAPDSEHLNAIFRAAHSIKGGAATFGFTALIDTTHLLENLLDSARHHQIKLHKEMINVFLETKDALQEQINAYRESEEPETAMVEHICAVLKQLAEESLIAANTSALSTKQSNATAIVVTPTLQKTVAGQCLTICFSGVSVSDCKLLSEEMANLGEIVAQIQEADKLMLSLQTSCEPDDIIAVCCFIIDIDQIDIKTEVNTHVEAVSESQISTIEMPKNEEIVSITTATVPPVTAVNALTSVATSVTTSSNKIIKENNTKDSSAKESSSIRVDVEKVDRMINLVGEMVITQSMLAQTASTLDPVLHERLLSGMVQLQGNTRDLQESVMLIRMMQMDSVFSRFPRLVRDLTAKLGKEVELITIGKNTELDKSLIEGIIDPLTHLVRNSLDHGIEKPEQRIAAGKNPIGKLTLSAQHQGGNIVIEVRDDGAGLNRERILAKAVQNGLINGDPDMIADDDVWQMIFAPGFSTAEKVTDVSGRGVGMDVVKRNIQSMGGQVKISSRLGQGSTIKIILPLTLAILEGMSVKVGDEVYILPLDYVIESLQPRREDIHSVANDEQVIHVRGEYLPLIALYQVFNVVEAKRDATQGIVVIVQAEGKYFALQVDQLIGQHQVVVKNLQTNYRKVPGISAATILGDGGVALIVDVGQLQHVRRQVLEAEAMTIEMTAEREIV